MAKPSNITPTSPNTDTQGHWNLGDTATIFALIVGVAMVVLTIPLWLRVVGLLAVSFGLFPFTRKSHWTHSWKATSQRRLAIVCVLVLWAIGAPQFLAQWQASHPSKPSTVAAAQSTDNSVNQQSRTPAAASSDPAVRIDAGDHIDFENSKISGMEIRGGHHISVRKSSITSKNKPLSSTENVSIPPGTTINATANAPDSTAVGINTGTINVNPPVNPNAKTRIYDCRGNYKDISAGSVEVNTGNDQTTAYGVMNGLTHKAFIEQDPNKKQATYQELMDKCNEQIKSVPQWLTSYVFCAQAHLVMGDEMKARELISYFDKHKGVAYNTESCKALSDHLHEVLKVPEQ
ncbi:MAG TPA: hypothetical protein VIK39_03195 [Candidatus Angelobacter sp.]